MADRVVPLPVLISNLLFQQEIKEIVIVLKEIVDLTKGKSLCGAPHPCSCSQTLYLRQ